jgi:hypothetical protein
MDVIVIGIVGDRDLLAGVSLDLIDVGIAGDDLQRMRRIKKCGQGSIEAAVPALRARWFQKMPYSATFATVTTKHMASRLRRLPWFEAVAGVSEEVAGSSGCVTAVALRCAAGATTSGRLTGGGESRAISGM